VSRPRGGRAESEGGVNATTILSALLVCLGVAVIVRTVLLGVGGGLGLLLGALLLAGGAARFYLARRTV
jgi:hypothetical protein